MIDVINRLYSALKNQKDKGLIQDFDISVFFNETKMYYFSVTITVFSMEKPKHIIELFAMYDRLLNTIVFVDDSEPNRYRHLDNYKQYDYLINNIDRIPFIYTNTL